MRYFSEDDLMSAITAFPTIVYAAVKLLIEKIPSADVQPVVHGKWEYAYWCEFRCSNCGAWSKSEPYRGQENFCYNCGAKMDAEDKGG